MPREANKWLYFGGVDTHTGLLCMFVCEGPQVQHAGESGIRRQAVGGELYVGS